MIESHSASALQESVEREYAWDFHTVLALLDTSGKPERVIYDTASLPLDSNSSSAAGETLLSTSTNTPPTNSALSEKEGSTDDLGDLDRVFRFLGQPYQTKSTNADGSIHISGNDSIDISTMSDQQASQELDTQRKPKKTGEKNRQKSEKHTSDNRKPEDGRRAVIASFIGSLENNSANRVSRRNEQKGGDPNKLVNSNLRPASLLPKTISLSFGDAGLAVAASKKSKLLTQLQKRFPGDLQSLKNINLPRDIPGRSDGIHVFVDISNILVGFHDALKIARGKSKSIRIPRQTLSFHNLSFILERGRFTAKKSLAGSDNIDCTQEAASLGYKTNILTKIEKHGPMSPPKRGAKIALSSDSDSNYLGGRVKRAEQGVDEVLHLDMLQSIVDSPAPSTMVVASGDAAEAEFSDGFYKQVERALRNGWKVEVVAFKANIGRAYRDAQRNSRWGSSFRIIELDDFVELLHTPREGSDF